MFSALLELCSLYICLYVCLNLCDTGLITTYIIIVVQLGSSRKDVHMLFPEEEKIIVEETRSNGQTVMEERWERRDDLCIYCMCVVYLTQVQYIRCQISGMSCVLFCSCRSLVDTVYSLKDEVQELKQVSLWFSFLLTCNLSVVVAIALTCFSISMEKV